MSLTLYCVKMRRIHLAIELDADPSLPTDSFDNLDIREYIDGYMESL